MSADVEPGYKMTEDSVGMREHQQIEWKSSWRDKYLKWICGFANAEGGVLVIGKDDAGRVVGVANAKKLLEDIPNKIRDVLGIVANVRLVEEQGREMIEIRVSPYPSPISYKGEYHYRSGSTKQELKGPALDRFLMRRHGRTWDSVPVPYVGVRDLSDAAIATFRKLAGQGRRIDAELLKVPNPALLDKLQLLEGDYLKRAAVLLFHSDPERFVTGASVKVGYFQTRADLLYHDEIHGDLFTQAQKTLEILVAKYLKAAISYQGIHRVESLPVPEAALREALLNALIHRDYAVAAPIQIRVFDDRLAIWNPGELPENWSVDNLLKQHSSRPYNPLIANAFFRAGEIEAWGRGIQKILDACQEAGTPQPLITCETRDIWIEFPFSPAYLKIIPAEGDERLNERLNEKLNETPGSIIPAEGDEGLGEKLGDQLGEKLGETPGSKRDAIIQIIRNNPKITVSQISDQLKMSRTGVHKNIQILVSQGYVRRIGPAKGGHWEVLT